MSPRIPITMCHGIDPTGKYPLTVEHLDSLIGVASEMGFESINYDGLFSWRRESGELPDRPIMFDFDHPVKSMRHEVQEILCRYGYTGNLFVNTGPMNPDVEGYGTETMTWEEVGELVELGWHIGAHTVTHPNLSELVLRDPNGESLSQEFEEGDATIMKYLGFQPRDFAFTGTSWSSVAEKLVMQRYRSGRLWIVGTEYQVDGRTVRYADLVGVDGEDEEDGGPPIAARYITRESPEYRLSSMEIQRPLIYSTDSFRRYLEDAISK